MKHFVNLLFETYVVYLLLSIIYSLGWQFGTLIFIIIFEAAYCLTEEENEKEKMRKRLKDGLDDENQKSE